MLTFIRNGLLMVCYFALCACVTKGYSGAELPEDKLATVSLKTPTVALVPLFWIFPFNTLAWLADDWYETTWSDSIEVNHSELSRFKTLAVKPGEIKANSKIRNVLSTDQIGSESCNYGSCKCKTRGDKDKKETVCERTVSCTVPMRVTARDDSCDLTLNAEAGKHYVAFIRDNILMMQEAKGHQLTQGSCGMGPIYHYDTLDTKTSTESCSC